jgi:hypothetical protein
MVATGDGTMQLLFRSSSTHQVGPLQAFRVDGEALRTEPGGLLIARHTGNVWRIDQGNFPRVQCKGWVTVWFERHSQPNASRTFGPYENFEMFDGVAYVADQHVLASLNPKAGNWYCHDDGQYWSAMVVKQS